MLPLHGRGFGVVSCASDHNHTVSKSSDISGGVLAGTELRSGAHVGWVAGRDKSLDRVATGKTVPLLVGSGFCQNLARNQSQTAT
jgi:hypothetical protein